MNFYEIKTVCIKNANDLSRVVSDPKVIDYHVYKNVIIESVDLLTAAAVELRKVILILEV